MRSAYSTVKITETAASNLDSASQACFGRSNVAAKTEDFPLYYHDALIIDLIQRFKRLIITAENECRDEDVERLAQDRLASIRLYHGKHALFHFT